MIEAKIKTLSQLKRIAADLKSMGKKVVFTNGCFDILHFGHVKYLEEAKSEGDILIVGVNDDESVRLIKGEGRPIIGADKRTRIIAALQSVDYVIRFREPDPSKVIMALVPDVVVKGGDWKVDQVAGGEFVKSHGGNVVITPYIEGHSTRSIIEKIQRNAIHRPDKK